MKFNPQDLNKISVLTLDHYNQCAEEFGKGTRPPDERGGNRHARPNATRATPRLYRDGCLSGSTMAPFPHPSHRTELADRPHSALGQDLTPSSTTRRAQAGSDVRARSARRGARVDSSRLFVA